MLPLPVFFSGGAGDDDGGVSVLKRVVARLSSMRPARITFSSRAVSPYSVDDYGRPRLLSRMETFLHAIAWPVIIAVIVGYGLAISFVALEKTHQLRNVVIQAQRAPAQSQVVSEELEP
jgi:hypothetical protein